MKKRKLSIVVPVYNEEENIWPLYRATTQVLQELSPRYSYEFVFSDNCSTDGTFSALTALASQDSNVKVIRLSRNFGYQRSLYTAYTYATGDAAIQLDCDLQDPPSLIPEFVTKWEEGYKVVYGVRTTRAEGRATVTARRFGYWVIDKLSEDSLPRDAGDFRLIDRKVLNELKKTPDIRPYLRGAIASMGFRQIGIPYDRSRRQRGESKFGLSSVAGLALDGVFNHSVVPLRIATFTALGMAALTFAGIVVYLVGKFSLGKDWPSGFATTTLLILLSILLNAVFLGIIGEYMGRIYLQVRNKSVAIVDQTINLGQPVE